jgi:hypothetical protein
MAVGVRKRRPSTADLEVDPALQPVVAAISKVPGVCAIGLGGSRSLGTELTGSDYDVIIFSDSDVELNHVAVREAVEALGGEMKTSRRLPGKSLLGELTIGDAKVELFFRKIDAISREIAAAREGRFSRVFNPLHVVGFVSTITISYATYCVPIWDPENRLKQLAASALPYPDALRKQMIKIFFAEAKVALSFVGKVRSVVDVPHVAALYARVIASWSLVLFAFHRRYPIIDKGGRHVVAGLPQTPANYIFRTNAILRAATAGDLEGAYGEARRLHDEIVALVVPRAPAAEPGQARTAPQAATSADAPAAARRRSEVG